jgi:hypothetical protein
MKLQFSLASLLVVVTAAGVGLGCGGQLLAAARQIPASDVPLLWGVGLFSVATVLLIGASNR